ncbi:hypothetical protein N752_30925 [Desulforamulus aquiferis]|nr:GntR family transcriptional regulator [Desulforamulus aquiferis]RYD01410.1 hypothetical protein N752_30925 [Desulforamulus aquiferis]
MKNLPLPLHYQISNELRKKLIDGQWAVGELFPGDKELMQIFNVSSTTVRRAIDELVREGWLERKPGKGTFIKRQYIETLGKLNGFFDIVRDKGYRPSSQVLQLEEVDIDTFEDSELSLFNSSRLFLIKKVQFVDENPIVLVKSFWPIEIGQKLAKYNLTNQGTYEIIQKELGIKLQEAHQYISAAIAGIEEAEYLELQPGDPILMMKRMAFLGDKPVELSVNYYRADRYRYRVVLKNEAVNIEDGILF